MDGILIVKKEKGMTSRDVVNYLNQLFEMKRIGHAGTLDPMAEGVLIVLLGKCTKLTDIITGEDKEYVATMELGIKTDTYDNTGEILVTKQVLVTKQDIINALNHFQGEYEQEVPIYSAVKVAGKRLYDYARQNEEVTLPKRIVNIKEIELIDFQENSVTFKCSVSKGTYVRSLINDLGNYLGCGASMSALMRTRQGKFLLDQAKTLEEISNNDYKIISLEEYLQDYPSEVINGDLLHIVKNGAVIDKTFTSKYFVYYDNDLPIAVYQEYAKDPTKAKPFLMI